MSEGKYGRLPKPKDRTRVVTRIGDISLSPIHDKASEWEEEDDSYHAHPKAAPEESVTSRIARALGDFAKRASASAGGSGYSSLLKRDDEE